MLLLLLRMQVFYSSVYTGAQVGIWNHMDFSDCVFRSNAVSGYAAGLWLTSVDPYSTQFNHRAVDITNW